MNIKWGEQLTLDSFISRPDNAGVSQSVSQSVRTILLSKS